MFSPHHNSDRSSDSASNIEDLVGNGPGSARSENTRFPTRVQGVAKIYICPGSEVGFTAASGDPDMILGVLSTVCPSNGFGRPVFSFVIAIDYKITVTPPIQSLQGKP